VPGGTGRVGEQWGESLDPPVDGDVVDLDTTFGQQLLDVAVGQAVAQVPADREHDHFGREPEPANAESDVGRARRRDDSFTDT
jgi:hypothetical protein